MRRVLLRWIVPYLAGGTILVPTTWLAGAWNFDVWHMMIFIGGVLVANAVADAIQDLTP